MVVHLPCCRGMKHVSMSEWLIFMGQLSEITYGIEGGRCPWWSKLMGGPRRHVPGVAQDWQHSGAAWETGLFFQGSLTGSGTFDLWTGHSPGKGRLSLWLEVGGCCRHPVLLQRIFHEDQVICPHPRPSRRPAGASAAPVAPGWKHSAPELHILPENS